MPDLVRVRLDGVEKNVGKAFAAKHGLTVLDEPTQNGDGSLRGSTRKNGRRAKPKTTVDQSATAKKKAASKPASTAEEATE